MRKNTKKQGVVTIFTYKSGNKYTAVCLELDIIKENKDHNELLREMRESIVGYLKTVCKNNLSDDLLNRPAPKLYWKKYRAFLEALETKKQVQLREETSALIWPLRRLTPAYCF